MPLEIEMVDKILEENRGLHIYKAPHSEQDGTKYDHVMLRTDPLNLCGLVDLTLAQRAFGRYGWSIKKEHFSKGEDDVGFEANVAVSESCGSLCELRNVIKNVKDAKVRLNRSVKRIAEFALEY